MVHDTPSHGSDHLCLIWKESIHNCRWYRADTACGTDGRTDGQTDGRTEWNQYTPQQLRCGGGGGYNKSAYKVSKRWSTKTSNDGQRRLIPFWEKVEWLLAWGLRARYTQRIPLAQLTKYKIHIFRSRFYRKLAKSSWSQLEFETIDKLPTMSWKLMPH